MLQRGELTVEFDEAARPVAAELAEEYPVALRELERTFGWEVGFGGGVKVLLYDEEDFRRLAGAGPIVAFARSRDSLIVMGLLRAERDAVPLRSIFKHELVHLYLGRVVGEGNLPRWLNEGVAQWASGGVSELLSVGRSTELDKAAVSGRLIPLEALEEVFPRDGRGLTLAYEESLSFVNYLVARHGVKGLVAVLGRLRHGDTVQEAMEGALGIGLEEMQGRWTARLRRENTLLTYLGENFYTLLFVLAALATVYGFARVVARARRYRDEDEDGGGAD
ncbi:MAG: peptidase MA family metallohydrolase [Nitrospirota bacterium]